MEGVSRPAADDRPMKASEAGDPGTDCGTETTLKSEPKEFSSRPSSESSPREGIDPCGDASTTQAHLSASAADPGSREVAPLPSGNTETDSGSGCDARAAGPTRADSRPAWQREEAIRNPTQTPSGFNWVVPPTTNEPGDVRPVTGLQNGERTTAKKKGNFCGVQPFSAEETVLSKGMESELSATARVEKNLPPCSDSSGEGNGNGRRGDNPIPSPYANIEESTRLNGAVEKGDALVGSTSSEAAPRSSNVQVAGAAPNGLGGGASQALASEETMERSGPSAVWTAGRDQAKYVVQEEDHSLRKAAIAKADVAEERESVLAEENSMPPSSNQPGQPSVSPESRRVESSKADGDLADADAARTSEEASIAQTERSGNGTVTPTRTSAVARTPPHDISSYSVIASGSISQDGLACQSLPGDSVWGSTERLAPMSRHRRGRVQDEQPESTPWGEPIEHESLGDTTDIALAAVSYANAVAEGGTVSNPTSSAAAGLESGGARGKTPPAANPTCGKSSILTAVENITAGPSGEGEGDRTVSADATVASATTQPVSRASSNGRAPSKVADVSKATVPTSGTSRALSSNGDGMTTRGEKGSSASNHHDDMMNAMCMICLEKLSDTTSGGRAKLLGLLDSCSHRYCYTCILEWSKITNKCPQCKARFHTIKAIKELRRSNDKYRGVAVRVEDRDQRYSFVDVRDVVVLDPDVMCHPGCLVRRGVDALQQGWEFSVQCEQCSNWYHGLCVGFRQEREVPDLWFCRPCRGEVYEVGASPDGIPQPTASSTQSGTSSVASNSGRGQISGQSSDGVGQNLLVPSVSGQATAGEVTRSQGQVPEQDGGNVGAPGTSRTVEDRHQGSGSRSEAEAVVAELPPPPHTPTNPAPPAPLALIQLPPPFPPPDAEARGSGAPYGSPQWTTLPPLERMLSLFGAQQNAPATPPQRPPPPVRANSAPPSSPPVVASPARGRGRPRGSRNKPASSSSPLAQPPASPQQSSESLVLPTPPARVQSAPSLPPTGDAASAKVRGRPRGSKKKPPVEPPAPPALECQPEGLLASASSAETPVLPPQRDGRQHQEGPAQPSTETSLAIDRPSREDAIPQPPEPPAPSFLRSLEASEVTDLCTICGFDTEPDNLIVYCSSCNMGVHQTCYGISEIPTKEWYCSPCSAGLHPSTLACRFCPVKGGALKRCTDESWGHILCAFWIPECCFLDPQKMEPIGSINRKGQAGGVDKFLPTFRARKCYVCGTSAGSAIRCHASSCKFHLHPMCGSNAGSVYMEIETTMKRGFDGTEHESVNLVARCPRHSKTKAKGKAVGSAADPKEPASVKRGSIIGSTADPLSIIDKTLEVKDPELGGVALAGKVTWFDPKRLKYCIVASGHGGRGGSIGRVGEPKEGCSHWITVDKLVEAKAIGVQKNGKKFVVEPLPSLEGEDTESGQLGNSVKIEQDDEEDKGRKEIGVLSAWDEGENNTEARTRDGGGSVGLEEAGTNDNDARTGKRRRTDTRPSTATPSDVAPAKHAAVRPEEESRAPLELGLQPTRTAPGEAVDSARLLSPRGEGSKSLTQYKVASESESGEIEKRSAASRSPIPQPTRLLPSVQFQEQPDAFARYPIRGRRKRQENLTFDPDEQRSLEGVPSAKRPRLEGDADQSLDVTADAGPDPPVMELACPGEAAVAGDPVHSAAGVCRAPQTQPSVFDLEPGWPHGMGLLGQDPVMRVRTVRVPGGGDATYFASAYASVAEGVVCDKRSAPCFSFPFEELEEMKLTGGTKQHADSLSDHPDQSFQLSGELPGREEKKNTLDDAGTKAREAETSRSPLYSELGQEEKEKEKGEEGTVDQTINVSSDSDDMEDGEINNMSSGRADIMSPSPRSDDGSIGGGVERLSPTGEQVAKEEAGNNEQTEQPECQNSSMTGEDESATKAKEMEMEISSDDVSCGGFEGAEAASPCISEDDEDDDDIGLGWDVLRTGGSAPKLSRADTQSTSPTLGATSTPPVPSLSATEITRVLRGPLSVESDEAVENSESRLDIVVSDEVRPEDRKSNQVEATALDEQAFPATSGGGSMPRLEGELSAPEMEPDIATVQPLAPQQTGVTLALRSIVREQLQGVLRSASKGEEEALAGEDGNDVLERIASDTEDELFRRLYEDITGGREYKAKYKQLLLSLGNVRNYRLVASVLAGNTSPVDLATKDAVGLLNSLSSSLNCLAIPLVGRHRQGSPAGSPAGKGHKGKGKHRGKMQLL